MTRFYSDENFPITVVEELINLGHDVLTIQETGMAQQSFPDAQVLKVASEDKRAVLTFNRKHFIALHKIQPNHEGIIVCTFDIDFVGLARRIHKSILPFDSISGMLIRINRPFS